MHFLMCRTLCPVGRQWADSAAATTRRRLLHAQSIVTINGYRYCKPPRILEEAMSDLILHVTDDSFEQDVLKADVPVLVDYWAEWCGPCKMIAPILDEVAKEYAGRLKVAKLNIDQNELTPPKFGIRGIPTLMIFKDGQVAATKVGALAKSQLAAFIDSHI
jgi:thioredoxin 1